MKKLFATILVILVIGLLPDQKTNACTNFLFTKGATKDGSVMITYSADSHVLYGELYYWPSKNWPAGSMLDIYEWDTGKYLGKIPQIAHTYSVVGNMNQNQVSIGETTYGGRPELADSLPFRERKMQEKPFLLFQSWCQIMDIAVKVNLSQSETLTKRGYLS
jgi:hypothetical protein